MKLTKYVRAIMPLFILFSSAVVYLQLAAIEVEHSSRTNASYMELACYFLIMLGLTGLCSELMMWVKRQRMRLLSAATIPIVFVVVVLLLNNYLHYVDWNSIPGDFHIPFSYFVKYDITYTIGFGKYRYIVAFGGMLFVCMLLYAVLGRDGDRKPSVWDEIKMMLGAKGGKEVVHYVETERTVLRRPVKDDLKIFLEIEGEQDRFGTLIGDDDLYFSGKASYKFVMDEYRQGDMCGWVVALRSSNRMIGFLNIIAVDRDKKVLVLSLLALEGLKDNQALQKEVLDAGVAYLFSNSEATRVSCEVRPNDIVQSNAAIELGMVPDDVVKIKENGVTRGGTVFCMLRE